MHGGQSAACFASPYLASKGPLWYCLPPTAACSPPPPFPPSQLSSPANSQPCQPIYSSCSLKIPSLFAELCNRAPAPGWPGRETRYRPRCRGRWLRLAEAPLAHVFHPHSVLMKLEGKGRQGEGRRRLKGGGGASEMHFRAQMISEHFGAEQSFLSHFCALLPPLVFLMH